MQTLFNDIHIALRSFLKSRGFTATVLLTLALAIGVNTATFAIVNSVLLKPLPVPDSERIVLMSNQYPKAGVADSHTSAVGDYYDRLKETAAFEEQALFDSRSGTFNLHGVRVKVHGMAVTPSFFKLIQVMPASGRPFSEAEGEIGNDAKIILSWGLARDFFADENPVGKQVQMDGRAVDVIGVMPQGFLFVDPDTRYWFPAAFDAERKKEHHSNNWSNVGRLKPGATIEQAQSQVDALNFVNLDRYPEMKQIVINAGFFTQLQPLREVLVRDVKRVLFLLWGGAILVLLIGGINVANLALARLALRRKEFATRMAIGAGRLALLRQILVEHVLLALGGGLLGVLAGFGLLRVLVVFGLNHFPRAGEVGIDPRVAAVSIAMAIAAGVLIALPPLADVFSTNLSAVLHEDGRSGTGGVSARRTRQGLVALQVAMAFALLVGAGLLFESFRNLVNVNPGYRTRDILVARVSLPHEHYESDTQIRTFYDRALELIRRLPGVFSAALTSTVPLSGDHSDNVIVVEGYQMAPGESFLSPMRSSVSAGYFETMEIALVSGRFFTTSDTGSAPKVVIVDEQLARKFWPGRDPVGKRLFSPQSAQELVISDKTQFMEVVGVVRNARITDLAGTQNTTGHYYLPFEQDTQRGMAFALRTERDPATIVPLLRGVVAGLDSELALSDVRTMTDRAALSLAPRRASMSLALGFGGLALFLAAVGIYGVLAYVVAQRNREIGIRMALGGRAGDIARLVLRESLALTGAGMTAGLIGAIALRNVIANEIYGVKPLDPVVIAVVALILLTVTVLASLIPARMASRVDPASVLRG